MTRLPIALSFPLIGLLSILTVFRPVTSGLISDLIKGGLIIVTPSSPGYANASEAYNQRFTLQPSVIAFPSTPAEVSIALSLATKYNRRTVARSGGMSYIANSLGGENGTVVVDMSNFTEISVNTGTNVTSIGVGNRLGDVALALNEYGRALPHGTCPYVGVGGHSGHGGYGFTSRKWGLLLDTIQQIEVVLSNGTIVNTSEQNYPDLFWALRGSSSSFGIVTTIHAATFAAPPSATIFVYNWDLGPSSASSATAAFQSFAYLPNLPAEFGAEIVLGAGSSKGRVSFGITGGWYAPEDQFQDVIQSLLQALPVPQSSQVTPGTYIDSVRLLGGLGDGRLNTSGIPSTRDTFYAKSLMTPESEPITNESLNSFYNYSANEGYSGTNTSNWFVEIELYGGFRSAINSVPINATAFAHRSSLFTIQFYVSSLNFNPPFPSEGFGLLDGMVDSIVDNNPSKWQYGAYLNYIDDKLYDCDYVWIGETLYYKSHYEKLVSLKKQYDPTDTFAFPLAIEE